MPGDVPLRVALLTYRGKPHVGGQGVYTRQLARALVGMGHHVEVYSGQPYPVVEDVCALHRLASLDIFNEHYPGRMPAFWELKHWTDVAETLQFSAGVFSEPLAFSLRAWDAIRVRPGQFDLVHDNQSLGYGVLLLARQLPVLETIHHPITVDRRLEMAAAPNRFKRWSSGRWYSFTTMQSRVARRLPLILTVSESSKRDIHADMGVPEGRMRVVPVGVDPDLFRPLPHIERRAGRLITTASADVTMKGLYFLLEAVAKLRTERDVDLVVIGRPKQGGRAADAIARLGLDGHVRFVSGVSDERIVELYAESELAVVPSLYEGFSLPAIEAMATGTCLVSTTGGALPEVCGTDGETTLACAPGDAGALSATLRRGLDDAAGRRRIGAAGRQRVVSRWSWARTAERTVEAYREVMAMRGRVPAAARPGEVR